MLHKVHDSADNSEDRDREARNNSRQRLDISLTTAVLVVVLILSLIAAILAVASSRIGIANELAKDRHEALLHEIRETRKDIKLHDAWTREGERKGRIESTETIDSSGHNNPQ